VLIPLLIAVVVGYVLGALPFGYLVARAHGVNIFEVGSKSSGATNVKRSVGPRAGNLVFALDVLKGCVAAGWALLAGGEATVVVPKEECVFGQGRTVAGEGWIHLGLAGLVGALLGHSFSCFTRFRGGKGVATAAGGFLVLMPWATLAAAGAWALTFFTSRYVSLASIVSALVLPLAAWGLGQPGIVVGLAAAVAVFVVVRHRANIARLVAGTENKFVKKKTS
jgi:glycerol-3-phosphate acyltransferase PlsY